MKRGIAFRFFLLPAAAVFLVLFSCASGPDAYVKVDADMQAGSYEAALASVDNEKAPIRKKVYTSKNEILLYLDRGMIKHFAGQYTDSSLDLETAEILIEQAFTKSISQEIGSFILNDNVKDYSGEDYEDLYINVFNSLNYYYNNNLEGALVEIRRLNEKLNFLADKYERAKEKVLESNKQIDASVLPMEASQFSNSALARYLGLLFYRAAGRTDSARIEYEELMRAFELAPVIYAAGVPYSVEEELSVPEGSGRLNVIAFTGLSPIKSAEHIFIPLPFPPPNNMARISIPILMSRPQTITRAEAVLSTGQKFPLQLIEDMGAVARETFKLKSGLIVLKTTARTITKAATSAVLASAARASERDKKKNNEGLGAFVGLMGRIFTEVSEQPDTRLSRYFPGQAMVGGINLASGQYKVTVNYYGNAGLVYSEQKEIAVNAGTLNLEEFVCLK